MREEDKRWKKETAREEEDRNGMTVNEWVEWATIDEIWAMGTAPLDPVHAVERGGSESEQRIWSKATMAPAQPMRFLSQSLQLSLRCVSVRSLFR